MEPTAPSPAPSLAQWIGLGAAFVVSLAIGAWAYVFPREFFESFPGVLGSWVAVDGPFNEHLVRDHGAQYLALAAAAAVIALTRAQPAFRVLGVAWITFGVLHTAYHLAHLDLLPAGEAVGQAVVLIVSTVLGAGMLLGPRASEPRRRAA